MKRCALYGKWEQQKAQKMIKTSYFLRASRVNMQNLIQSRSHSQHFRRIKLISTHLSEVTLISQTFFLNVVWDGVHEYFCCFPMFEYHSVLHEFPSLRRCRRKIVGIYKPGTVISQYSILVLHGSYSSKAFIYKIAK